MAGTSYKALETEYGELSGTIASQWGEDVMATIDDKLHLSEQTSVQTVSGPVNWTKSGSTHTFASPIDANAGIDVAGSTATFQTLATFAAGINVSANTATFGGLVDINAGMTVAQTATFSSTIITPNSNNLASLLTNEVSQLGNLGASISVSVTQWGYVGDMDQPIKQGSNVTWGNLFFKDGTAYTCQLAHAATAARVWTFPNQSGTVALWDQPNAPVTVHYSVGFIEIGLARETVSPWDFLFALDFTNQWAIATVSRSGALGIHLPEGAVVTALRVHGQYVTAGSNSSVRLYRMDATDDYPGDLMAVVAMTTTMEETSDTDIDNATIDNENMFYHLQLNATVSGETRYKRIQIDYTVDRPYDG